MSLSSLGPFIPALGLYVQVSGLYKASKEVPLSSLESGPRFASGVGGGTE